MTEQLLFRNLMRITPGHLDEFREAVKSAINFVESHAPQLMVQTFIDEKAMQAVSIQLYRNSEDVLSHWQMSDAHINNVSAHCAVERLEVYGAPNEEVAKGLAPFIGDGRGFIMPPLTGFSRF
ncbi:MULTISPECIES: hypothetical protein [unclassified Ensifer]|uniref:hypothetical protein n=1 Tax=unclassified Ensifer TaxID=2633371 RepID=UPI0008132C75|nr:MULTISPECIES: hypothetical protein [unclassified Ensifer]OCP01697.1 hypothetical protein BC362_20950 [Ensifer sp. LC14]OCP09485.1 hypothetical protein BC374_02690 [Ensifer sp. LC13]OCP10659.1 hypothetical protein BBX50_03035 [Ensifer sp. LC11]OCP32733.1 hypothetical protein BC364_02690 [Ensifer sp. LC499]